MEIRGLAPRPSSPALRSRRVAPRPDLRCTRGPPASPARRSLEATRSVPVPHASRYPALRQAHRPHCCRRRIHLRRQLRCFLRRHRQCLHRAVAAPPPRGVRGAQRHHAPAARAPPGARRRACRGDFGRGPGPRRTGRAGRSAVASTSRMAAWARRPRRRSWCSAPAATLSGCSARPAATATRSRAGSSTRDAPAPTLPSPAPRRSAAASTLAAATSAAGHASARWPMMTGQSPRGTWPPRRSPSPRGARVPRVAAERLPGLGRGRLSLPT
jgi:hypothetical protein